MNIIVQSIFPIRKMRTEDRCLTGVTTSSAPPDCLAPVLPGLDQSEASLWSPDLVSKSEASLTTCNMGGLTRIIFSRDQEEMF